jgi:hypothetical protein
MGTELKDYSPLISADLFFKSVRDCKRLDCFRKENIRQTLNVTPLYKNTDSYRQRWGEHLLRKDESRIPEIIFKYSIET